MELKTRAFIDQEDEYIANCLVWLSNNAFRMTSIIHHEKNLKEVHMPSNNKFQCKTCNKIFYSHQALGGHRASHKNVKGCFASTNFNDTGHEFSPHNQEASISVPCNIKRKRSKVHECLICHRTFASGQALGGHKRCHWVSNFPSKTASNTSLAYFHDEIRVDEKKCEALDLNLFPAVKENDEEEDEVSLKFEDENCKKQNMKKLKRMSDLDEGGSNAWLQMGISSSSNLGDGTPSS